MNALLQTSGSTQELKPTTDYLPAIDGLRAVAILGVLIFHLNHSWLPGGFVGVDIFFVISGYLITTVLLRDYKCGRFALGRFYQRRIARLLPSFVAVALATIAGAYLVYSDQDLASAGINLSASALSAANIKFMLQGNYFALSPDAQPFLHCWSLSVEEQFYIIFPATLLLLSRKGSLFRVISLTAILAASLISCIVETRIDPQWAFFLLPTRAWELLSGCMLALCGTGPFGEGCYSRGLAPVGLALICVSFAAITEGPKFPGYLAIVPVLGSVLIIAAPRSKAGFVERLLSWSPMVLIGQMSYSLYLWHWPVFSLVDYHFYLLSPFERGCLKVLITGLSTVICYVNIERPGRAFFNETGRQLRAFAFLACILVAFVPLGIAIRRDNYINAEPGNVSQGGLVLNRSAKHGSIVLMGDSYGSMYGKLAKEIAVDRDLRLTVISVAAGDPLPKASGKGQVLWDDSIAVVRRIRPDYVLLACDWRSKLKNDPKRLSLALEGLSPFARSIIIIAVPPRSSPDATRDAMRRGSRPPFLEDADERAKRNACNAMVISFRRDQVAVVDIEPLIESKSGVLAFNNQNGQLLYQDGEHLSGAGAMLLKPLIVAAMNRLQTP